MKFALGSMINQKLFKASLSLAFKRYGNSTPNFGYRNRFVGCVTNALGWERFGLRFGMFSIDRWDFEPILRSQLFSAPLRRAGSLCPAMHVQLV